MWLEGAALMDGFSLKDVLYIVLFAVGVSASHFMLRAKIMVLEERMRGYSKAITRVFDVLQRIEHKLDSKADR